MCTTSTQGEKDLPKELPHEIKIARGMRVLVTDNLETDIDLANGAQGDIVDILLYPGEAGPSKTMIKLRYLPLYTLLRIIALRGVTIPYVLLDIAPPPTGTLNLFILYVALSRSCGRETIRLLQHVV